MNKKSLLMLLTSICRTTGVLQNRCLPIFDKIVGKCL